MLTREYILSLEAGREMDALVAEKVMGIDLEVRAEHEWETTDEGKIDIFAFNPSEYHNGPCCKRCSYGYCHHCEDGPSEHCKIIPDRYSTDISAAWEVVEKIKSIHDISLHSDNSDNPGFHVMISEWGTIRRLAHTFAKEAPLAICRASLLTTIQGE